MFTIDDVIKNSRIVDHNQLIEGDLIACVILDADIQDPFIEPKDRITFIELPNGRLQKVILLGLCPDKLFYVNFRSITGTEALQHLCIVVSIYIVHNYYTTGDLIMLNIIWNNAVHSIRVPGRSPKFCVLNQCQLQADITQPIM